MLAALSPSAIFSLCSGQVITGVEDAVQQLLENSLDACADRVCLKLVGHGLTTLSIEDNGHGMRASDCQVIGVSRGASSKRDDAPCGAGIEPQQGSSYGWRGEALHALIQVSESAMLVTRLAGAELATRVEWQKGQRVAFCTTSVRSTPGSTFSFNHLFYHLPVRQANLKANGRKELSRIVSLLQSFCSVHPALSLQLYSQSECLLNVKGQGEPAHKAGPLGLGLSLSRLCAVYPQLANMDLYPVFAELEGEGRWTGYFSDPYAHSAVTKKAGREWIWMAAKRPVRRLAFAERAVERALESLGLDAGCILWMMLSFESSAGKPYSTVGSMPSLDMNLTPDKRSIYMRREEEWCIQLQTAFYDALTRLPTKKQEMSPSVPRALPFVPLARSSSLEQACAVPRSLSSPLFSSASSPIISPAFADTLAATAAAAPFPCTVVLPDLVSSPSDHYFERSDFKQLSVVGQYNAGFIVALLGGAGKTSLWIIDQHAADEKARYEALLKSYRESAGLTRIKMLHPVELKSLDQRIRIALKDERILSVMSSLGFEFRIEASDRSTAGEGETEEKADERVFWTCRPSSLVPGDHEPLAVQVADCLEMLQAVLADSSAGSPAACMAGRPLIGRAQAALASKACRTAVMIGTPLSRVQMTGIVKRLATLEAPWTCPHGRPTLQFLHSLAP